MEKKESMLALAELYAKNQGTSIVAHSEIGDTIVFVLENGQKLAKSREQLEAETSPAPTAAPTAPPVANGGAAPEPPKAKAKKGKGTK